MSAVAAKHVRIRDWFAEHELEKCPRCERNALLKTGMEGTLCTECGFVVFARAPRMPPPRRRPRQSGR